MSDPSSTSIHPLGTVGFTRVRGRDARDYLNRRLAQKTLDIPDGGGRRAFLLDAVGKLQLDMEIFAHGDDLFLVAPPQGRAEVIPQLERYVFAEDCTFTDLSDGHVAFAILGPDGHGVLGELDVPVPAVYHVTTADNIFAFGSDYALGETLLLVPATDADDWLGRLKDAARMFNANFIEADQFNALRIAAGLPAWLVDVTREDMPLDAPSLRHGLHFDKGCYPGQEALARIVNLGHPARCLIQLRTGALPDPGDSTLADADTGANVGRLTSAAFSPTEGAVVALGMVKWSARESGRRFSCGEVLLDSLGPVPATEALGR